MTLPFQKISVAVDAAIFTIHAGEVKMLLIQMKKKPYIEQWAMPGGLIEKDETSEQAARRILLCQTGVKGVYLEQLATFDDPKRDAAGRVLSVAYIALVPSASVHLQTTDKYTDIRWWSVSRLPKLAYDHRSMAKVALDRLRAKVGYTNIVWSILPLTFSLSELQRVYEIILGEPMDKRNFRKKIFSLALIEKTGQKREGEAHRPAALYQFKKRQLEYVDLFS